jgi:hypothetical protein
MANDWMRDVLGREAGLPEDVRKVFAAFRNAMAGEPDKAWVWREASEDLRDQVEPSSPQRKALNRIYQILQTRQRKAVALSRSGDEDAWEAYLGTILTDILDILEEAWSGNG